MVDLHPGMKVHAKKVSIYLDNGTELEYNAPRGQKFAMILMSAEDPSDTDHTIKADEFLNDMGWQLVDE